MSGVLLRERGFQEGDGCSSRLRFRLLGPLQTHRGTKALELGPPKQRALLAVLLLRPGLETGVDQLIEALWGEDHPAYAKNLIQKSVSGLRGLLSPDAADAGDKGDGRGVRLEWSAGGYRMDIGDAEADLYAYERLAAAGIAAARTRSTARTAATRRWRCTAPSAPVWSRNSVRSRARPCGHSMRDCCSRTRS